MSPTPSAIAQPSPDDTDRSPPSPSPSPSPGPTDEARRAAAEIVLALERGDQEALRAAATPEALKQLESYNRFSFDETRIRCDDKPASGSSGESVVCEVAGAAFLLPSARFHFRTEGGRLVLVLVEPLVD